MDLSSKAGHSCFLPAMLLLPLLLLILPRIEGGALPAADLWSDEEKTSITERPILKLDLLQSRISSQEQAKLHSTTLSPKNHSLNSGADIDLKKENRNLPPSFLSDREEAAVTVKQFHEIEEGGTPSKLRLHHQPRRALQQQRQFPPLLALLNPSLRAAYVALQAWKASITSDPHGITSTWVGFNVCKYKGVFCAPPRCVLRHCGCRN